MKFVPLFFFILLFSSCKKESATLPFAEINILKETTTTIEINMPKAVGESLAAEKINTTLNQFTCQALHIDAAAEKKENLEESMQDFNNAYANFNTLISSELKEELPKWEALIDGEVIFKKTNFACIVMNSSINTGAANSNLVLRFFNFDTSTGDLLTTNDLINNVEEFTTLIEKYYNKEVNSTFTDADNLLNNNQFKLPETLGFSDEGVIILYDNFSVGAFEKEIVEFTIPYQVANTYLKI
ncbi:DUF4163 domain-containing protein [Oceanihabitans sp. 2_MG-2023]|uniref:DUF3298 and DUF4163 domain-containing protein n=1 Tax=Oceanihabitans sp. 2_MG-2023 TaxID=3062661 RepID=UPI0026E32DAC|nr:DUF4163 domain-containing protein [Oceanihabitans sp. 2_MG-2023]MDO6595691.1 DUF4163 domain-containing protein [Oceanihabitans sp. 2_MG-2023]